MENGQDGCEFGRKLEQRIDGMEGHHNQAVEQIQDSVTTLTQEMGGRPTWAVSIAITILVALVTIMGTLLAAA